MHPCTIRFGQDTISYKFRDGRTLYELFQSLMCHELAAFELPPLRIQYMDGEPYCVDGNRRLFVLQKLGQYGMVDYVRVRVSDGPPKPITAKVDAPIRIRGQPELEQEMNEWFTDLHEIVFTDTPHKNYRFGFCEDN